MTRKTVFMLASALMLSTVAVGSAAAQETKPAKPAQHAKHAKQKNVVSTPTKSRGADSSVAVEMKPNSRTATVRVPVAKGGHKTRGDSDCSVLHVDNRTQWNIRIYVDGEWVGTVGSYGDVYGTYCGASTLSARAYFDDGDVYTWGPVTTDFSEGDKRWTLNN